MTAGALASCCFGFGFLESLESLLPLVFLSALGFGKESEKVTSKSKNCLVFNCLDFTFLTLVAGAKTSFSLASNCSPSNLTSFLAAGASKALLAFNSSKYSFKDFLLSAGCCSSDSTANSALTSAMAACSCSSSFSSSPQPCLTFLEESVLPVLF